MTRSLKDLIINRSGAWSDFLSFREGRLKGLGTGIKQLDLLTGGFFGVAVIQGAPASCKSTLALQAALNNAQNGVPTLVIDRENGEGRLRTRILCQVSGLPADEILKCDKDELRGYVKKLQSLPLFIETQASLTPKDLRVYIDEMMLMTEGPVLVVLDSLQRLPRIEPELRQNINAWLLEIDQMKLDYKGRLVIILTSEKGRPSYGQASLSGGKESGTIEYAGEIVIDMVPYEEQGVISATVVKNRDGVCWESVYLRKVCDGSDRRFIFELEATEVGI